MNKKLYQTAGKKEITKDLQEVNILGTLGNQTNIPKGQEWKDGKIIKLVTTGSKTKRVQIGVYYTNSKGQKIKGLKPPANTIPRTRKMGGINKYQYGGRRTRKPLSTDMFDTPQNIDFNPFRSNQGLYSSKFNLNPRVRGEFNNNAKITLGPNLSGNYGKGYTGENDQIYSDDRHTLGLRGSFQTPIGRGGLVAGLSGEAGAPLGNRTFPNNNDHGYGQIQGGLGYYPKNSNLGIKANVGYGTERSSVPGASYGVTGNYGPATFNIGKDRRGVNAGFGLSLPLGQSRKKMGGMYEQSNSYEHGGAKDPNSGITALRKVAPNVVKTMGYGMGGMMKQYEEGGPTHTMPDGTVHPGATHEEYMAMMGENQMQKYQGGGMYGSNTMSAAGQGGPPQLGLTSTLVGEETDPSLQEQRLQNLENIETSISDDANRQLQQGQSQLAQADAMSSDIGDQGARTAQQVFNAKQNLYSGAVKGIGEQVGQTVNPQGGYGGAMAGAKGAYAAQKFANTADKAFKAYQASQAVPGAAPAFFRTVGTGVNAGKNIGGMGMAAPSVAGATAAPGSSALLAGAGNFLKSGAGIGTVASLAGMGISKLSDDGDPTKSNVGEYTGSILGSAGTGAAIGSYLGPAGTVIGGVGGALYGAGKQYFGTKNAQEAEEKAIAEYEEEQQDLRDEQVKGFNDRIGGLYAGALSSSAAGNIKQKSISGQNLGRNVMYKNGGMMMGMPRYRYNS